MSEKWILSKGVLEDGSQALILADVAYSSPKARGGREILLALNFPGTYMMQAQDRRDAVLDQMVSFLTDHDGVHVAGITLLGTSYTFLFYLGRGADRHEVPIPPECAGFARVWLAYDPHWMEYSSFVPIRRGLLERLQSWWNSLRSTRRTPPRELTSQDDGDGDEDVLRALASAGSNLTKPTDIVFYLYVPTREDADRCYCTLWENGFRTRVSIPLGALPDGTSEHRWSVISNLDAVPTSVTIGEARKLMEELARDCGGEFDGWEAAIAKG
jgi:hypothetical protein